MLRLLWQVRRRPRTRAAHGDAHDRGLAHGHSYDPGDFIPVGRVTMPAKYPASWEMAASYGYASKMADPDPVVALKAISAAPNCQIEINPRLLFV